MSRVASILEAFEVADKRMQQLEYHRMKKRNRVLERLPYDPRLATEVVLGLLGVRLVLDKEARYLIEETARRHREGVNADIASLPSAGLLCLREQVPMAHGKSWNTRQVFRDPALVYAVQTHLKVLDSNRELTDRAAAEKNLIRLYQKLGLNRKVPLSRRGSPSEFTGYRNVVHKITKPVSYARRHLTWYHVYGPKICACVPHLPKLCKLANDRGMI